jgi:hypothetical protein
MASFIEPDNNTAANVFCFAAFAGKCTGIFYSDLTGTFPFMLLEGNVCFLVVYHCETNAILALSIKTPPTNASCPPTKSNLNYSNQKGTKSGSMIWTIKKAK